MGLADEARRADLVQRVGAAADRLHNGAMYSGVADLVGEDERRLREEHAAGRQDDIAQVTDQTTLGLEPLKVGGYATHNRIGGD